MAVKITLFGFLMLLIASVVLCGAGGAVEWTPVTVTDALGMSVVVSEYPEKIISLAPACTEIIYALGAGNRLVGNTVQCNYPDEAKNVEKVGEISSINRERIISLSNGSTVIFASPLQKELVDYLRQQGLTVIVVNLEDFESIYPSIDMMGKALGNSLEASGLITDIKSEMKNITDNLVKGSSKPTVMYLMGIDPYWVSGNNTFQDDLIQMAGGINAVNDIDGWSAISLEKILVVDPQIIIVSRDSEADEEHSLRSQILEDSRFNQMQAVKNNDVYSVDADIFERGGPRITEALHELVEMIHPEIFGGFKPKPTETSSIPILGMVGGLVATGFFLMRLRR